ncbi:homogentisate 1,2-dioxygenase [Kamptonema cortianum]|nr:homogentisate 1,2-dioxygenase [Geitlerinema splendidum]MDK3156860.1 homogentisate 1,2-dioxygenase [Kamptonema cortianum]
MIRYHALGNLPAKKHIQFKKPDGSLYAEQLFSTHGFSGPMSTMYHINLPTEVAGWEDMGSVKPEFLPDEALRHRHLLTERMQPHGDFLSGRVPLMGNSDCVWHQILAAESLQENRFYKNAEMDEILFVHDQGGTLHSMYGDVTVRPGDYLVIPRGTIYRLDLDAYPARIIAIETHGPVTPPKRYYNNFGQLLEHAPYSERDFRPPHVLKTYDEEGDFEVVVAARGRHTLYKFAFHPFDIVGWDGYVYPVAFSIHDFQPITGQIHMPPPTHQTFHSPAFVICSFCPRALDFHPEAIKIPYNHSNVDSDEVLYYCNDKFGSRKGIKMGSITLHPLGIPHGPQPGAVEASMAHTETHELAVMMDTFRPLMLTKQAISLEDPDYWKSWQTR